MDVVLWRIEALPGDGRYAVIFRVDGAEQGAVVHVSGDRLAVADAALPAGWTAGTEAFDRLVAAVLAMHQACSSAGSAPLLRDVAGGWDVALGNVVLVDGVPVCAGHGPMAEQAGTWTCAECGARAAYARHGSSRAAGG